MKTKTHSFAKVVAETPDVCTCYQKGLQALGKYSKKIDLEDTSKCEGSLDIDACTTKKYPNDSRWDYALSYNNEVFFVEVHSANTNEVQAVLKKLQWLKDWLRLKAPAINQLKAKKEPFCWIQSSKFSIPKQSQQYRQIVQAGLKPIPKLTLK
jgi:hypothetical protein